MSHDYTPALLMVEELALPEAFDDRLAVAAHEQASLLDPARRLSREGFRLLHPPIEPDGPIPNSRPATSGSCAIPDDITHRPLAPSQPCS